MTATYDCIATTTLGSATNTVTFSSISGAYTDLVLVCGSLGMSAGGSAGRLRFNGDTGSNYSGTWVVGTGSSTTSALDTNQTSMRIIGAAMGPGTANNDNFIFQINNYSNTTTNKTVIGRGNTPANETYAIVGLWRNTAAITSLTIISYNGTDNFNIGSTFTLYGIKAE